MENDNKEIMKTQSLISNILQVRFSSLKLMYEKNKENIYSPNQYDKFINELMYMYRNTIVIDLCKLFIIPNLDARNKDFYKGNSQQNNFYNLIKKFENELGEVSGEVEKVLTSILYEVKIITYERDKYLAHKDSKTGSNVEFHLNNMIEIEELVLKSKEIVELLHGGQIGWLKKDNKILDKVVDFLKSEKERKKLLFIPKND